MFSLYWFMTFEQWYTSSNVICCVLTLTMLNSFQKCLIFVHLQKYANNKQMSFTLLQNHIDFFESKVGDLGRREIALKFVIMCKKASILTIFRPISLLRRQSGADISNCSLHVQWTLVHYTLEFWGRSEIDLETAVYRRSLRQTNKKIRILRFWTLTWPETSSRLVVSYLYLLVIIMIGSYLETILHFFWKWYAS